MIRALYAVHLLEAYEKIEPAFKAEISP